MTDATGNKPKAVPVVQTVCVIGIVAVIAIGALYPDAPNLFLGISSLAAIALGLEFDPFRARLGR